MSADETQQAAVIAFLSNPVTHGGAKVERLSTHGAQVFLAGDLAFKLKRAVKLPFFDFSTPEKRRAMLERELELNRSFGSDLYLEVKPILWRSDGGLGFADGGPVADWVLVMHRFPQECLLDAIAVRGGLTTAMIDALAARIGDMHKTASAVPGPISAAFARAARDNIDALRAAPVDQGKVTALERTLRPALAALADNMDRRAAQGFVRRCHGDLHLGNIVLRGGEPIPFDALEFDDALATGDVYYDLAFVLMDLLHRGLSAPANRLLNRYIAATGDLGGLPALRLFIAVRALVRAKVAAIAAGQSGDAAPLQTAMAYMDLAVRSLAPARPRLIAVGGLSGTGKSALAMRLAPMLAPAPGGVVLRSDILRKMLAGAPETQRLPSSAYTPAASAQVYDRLLTNAAAVLSGGLSVVVDAVFAKEPERTALEDVARQTGAPFTGLWLEAPLAARIARIGARRNDASDADAVVAEAQEGYALGAMTWRTCDAGGTPEETAARAAGIIAETG